MSRWARRLSVRARLTIWYSGVLLTILLLVSALSYSLLRRSLVRDLDASLLIMAEVIRDTGYSETDLGTRTEAELREILGPEFYDKMFQFADTEGHAAARSAQLKERLLPLSRHARSRAVKGERTFETVELPGGEPVRLLTMPVMEESRPVRFIQVGIAFERVDRTLGRYLETLLVVVPLGVALAATGGAILARSALAPVDAMSRTARRITAQDLSQRLSLSGGGDELDHLAGTLNAMLARLEDAFAQMRRFAADAAHELRTPLTVLKGGMEVALRADRPRAEYQQVLRSSLEEVERLIRLAEDLLLLSRLSAAAPTTPGLVDLEPVFLDVVDAAARLADGKGVSIRVTDTAPVTVPGEASTLRRALRNLVENAVKYTPAGGKVELGLERADGWATVTVSDTGVGMEPADAARIFQPFVRLDAARARDTGGAGLGLAIARSIVTGHGGSIDVRTSPGAGSTFTVRLPRA